MADRKRTLALVLPVAVLGLVGGLWLLRGSTAKPPPGLGGAIVFVSDRDGLPALYWRHLPRGRTRRLSFGSEPAADPAISPDGTRVAFAMGGRLALVAVASGETRVLTLGVDWKDAQPAWLPDGRRLVVSSRRRAGEPAGLHLIEPRSDGTVERSPITRPSAGDDTSPAPLGDGRAIVFVRGDRLLCVELADGRVRRLTGGFKREAAPRVLPSGRVVCVWSEGRRHGIDVIDADGGGRETLVEGDRLYRALAASADGRYLLATQAYDVSAHPLGALLPRRRDALRLLDARGRDLGVLETSAHSADWTR
jgi:Tol biopolymer transport system component